MWSLTTAPCTVSAGQVAHQPTTATLRPASETRFQTAFTLRMPLVTGTVGNVGTVSFLGDNIQKDWRGQMAANMTWVAGAHSTKFGTEYNHVWAAQKFGFNQFGVYQISGPSATMLEVLSLGGPTPNRFDAPSSSAAPAYPWSKIPVATPLRLVRLSYRRASSE